MISATFTPLNADKRPSDHPIRNWKNEIDQLIQLYYQALHYRLNGQDQDAIHLLQSIIDAQLDTRLEIVRVIPSFMMHL